MEVVLAQGAHLPPARGSRPSLAEIQEQLAVCRENKLPHLIVKQKQTSWFLSKQIPTPPQRVRTLLPDDQQHHIQP